MDEALFTRLAQRLVEGAAVVLASVIQTRGATPRKPGARMLVEADRIQFSVGGGAMEARVIAAARGKGGSVRGAVTDWLTSLG